MRLSRETRHIAVWGAGPFGRRLARAMEPHGVRVARFVDIDPDKIGRTARGAPITAHHTLDPSEHFVVFAVGSLGARALVRDALAQLHFVEGRDFLCAA
jgi:NADH/NAD ratio-sensing transcriptional regulator Rex